MDGAMKIKFLNPIGESTSSTGSSLAADTSTPDCIAKRISNRQMLTTPLFLESNLEIVEVGKVTGKLILADAT